MQTTSVPQTPERGEPFTVITSNGSPRWAGEEPASIDELLQVLASTPLDPDFEHYGNFIMPRPCRAVQAYTTAGEIEWVDGDPFYPKAPGLVRFWGNFLEMSHVFQIDTDDADLIARLTKAIRSNQRTQAYRTAKAVGDKRTKRVAA
jgi:hypothetical protein